MIESITAAGGTDGRTATAGQGKNPNPCVPSQPSLNPCGSPPAYACTHTQGWLGSPRCRGEEESRGEARKGEEDPRQLPGISCLRLCRGRSLPAGTGQRPPRPRARGDVCRCPAERLRTERMLPLPSGWLQVTDGPIQPQDFLHTLSDAAQTKVCWKKPALSKNVLLLAVWVKVSRVQNTQKTGFRYNPQRAVLLDVDLSPRGAG